MLRAQITPLTLWQIDNTIFNTMSLPSRPFNNRGYEELFLTGWDIDRETLVDNILMETAELSTLYTDPDFFKKAVEAWSKKELPVWQSLYESMFFRYNPIWNKDGTLKHTAREVRNLASGVTRQGSNGGTVTESGTDSRTRNLNETIERDEDSRRTIADTKSGYDTTTETPSTTETEQTVYGSNDTTENKVAAFNDSTYQNRDQSTTGKTGTDTRTTGRTGTNTSRTDYNSGDSIDDQLISHNDDTSREVTETESGTSGKTQTISNTDSSTETGSDTGTIEHTNTDVEQGNIGVTMTQQLIEAERNIVKFNIYDYIIESFKARFCVLVY